MMKLVTLITILLLLMPQFAFSWDGHKIWDYEEEVYYFPEPLPDVYQSWTQVVILSCVFTPTMTYRFWVIDRTIRATAAIINQPFKKGLTAVSVK